MLRWYVPANDLLTVIRSFVINKKWRSHGTGMLNDPSRNLYDDLEFLDLVIPTEKGEWPRLFWKIPMNLNDIVESRE